MSWFSRYKWIEAFGLVIGSFSFLSIVAFLVDPENRIFDVTHMLLGYFDWVVSWAFWPIAKIFSIFNWPFELTQLERHSILIISVLVIPSIMSAIHRYVRVFFNAAWNLNKFWIGLFLIVYLVAPFILLANMGNSALSVDKANSYDLLYIIGLLILSLFLTMLFRRRFFVFLLPVVALIGVMETIYRIDVDVVDDWISGAIAHEKTLRDFQEIQEPETGTLN